MRLISRDPWLTIRPRLYERDLATARFDLRPFLDSIDVDLVLGDVIDVDPAARSATATIADSARTFDCSALVLSTGSYIARDILGASPEVHDIDTHAAATTMRDHLLTFGRPADVIVIGAGLAGIELATELAAEGHRITLIERHADPGASFGRAAWAVVTDALEAGRVEQRYGVMVHDADATTVTTSAGVMHADMVVLTSGLRARTVFPSLRAPRDHLGRIQVGPTLAIPATSGAFAAGDVAHVAADGDHVAPMSCQTAIPMGAVAGANAVASLIGDDLEEYHHDQYVTCVDLGAAGALFTEGWDRIPTIAGERAKAVKRMIVAESIVPDPATFGQRRLIA